jgi:phenylacetic acid degradation operon negative regulatory protein
MGRIRHNGIDAIGASPLLRDPTESVAQRLIITMLGDYRHVMDAPIASSALVRILGEFDVTPDASRKGLSNLTARGYLRRTRSGRETAYELSVIGGELVNEATSRIFTFGDDRKWDGSWTAVAFSVTEKERSKRHALRTALRALGFGPLYDGLWIAAYCGPDEVRPLIAELDIGDATIMNGDLELLQPKADRLYDAWHLGDVRAQYQAFLEAFTPSRGAAEGQQLSPAAAFVLRTNVMDAWRVFPRIDPELPLPFEPPHWPRHEAKELFTLLYTATKSMAEIRFSYLTGGA